MGNQSHNHQIISSAGTRSADWHRLFCCRLKNPEHQAVAITVPTPVGRLFGAGCGGNCSLSDHTGIEQWVLASSQRQRGVGWGGERLKIFEFSRIQQPAFVCFVLTQLWSSNGSLIIQSEEREKKKNRRRQSLWTGVCTKFWPCYCAGHNGSMLLISVFNDGMCFFMFVSSFAKKSSCLVFFWIIKK